MAVAPRGDESRAAADHPAPMLTVWVELEGSPAARSYLDALDGADASRRQLAVDSAQQQMGRLQVEQQTLATALRAPAIGAVEIYSLQRLANGIAVRVTADRLDAIRRLPGVARLQPLPVTVLANSTSVPFLGIPASAWDGAGAGVTGAGIDIGIIDTGVDYLHVDFAGSGEAADYAANDPLVISDGFFPTAKVAGGWDFAGDAYDASSSDPAASMPMPDPDPMDCEGHGTHVAGTAAGFGVTGAGTTYLGTYDASTDFSALSIGPGVAPEARLYALRVFGCSGTTVLVPQALEWAVDPNGDGDFSDRLDVVNLSLASRYGAADDLAALAADLASDLGVVVVAAAGNDGDNHFIVGSPAVADSAIAVAATWDDDDLFPAGGIRVESPIDLAGSHQAGGANFGPPLTEPGITALAALADPAEACAPLSNGGEISGKIAVVESTETCTAVSQTRHAQDAGAVGVVLIGDGDELAGVFNDGTGGDITIPPVYIRQTTGETIRQRLDEEAVELTILRLQLADAVAAFSSRGPRRQGPTTEAALKPDVAAPGVIITSARLGNSGSGGSSSIIKSGTSMATPHVAGLSALLRQQRPTWSPAEIKAALMTNARDVFLDPESTPPLISPSRAGSGRIDPAVLTGDVLIYGQDEPRRVGISFGQIFADIATPTLALERQAVIDNRGNSAITLGLEIRPLWDTSGVSWSLPDGPGVVVPANGQVTVPIRLEINAQDLRHEHDPALAETAFGFDRFWLSETAAHLLATPSAKLATTRATDRATGGSAAFRLPIHAAVRPAAALTASSDTLPVGAVDAGSVDLAMAGNGIVSGAEPPQAIRSLTAVLELQHLALSEDPALDPALDLQAVGVGSDLAVAGSIDSTRLVFGVVTRGASSTPNTVRTSVFIDVDDDQVEDYELYSSDVSNFTFPGFATDAFASVLRNLDSETESLQLPLGLLTNDDLSTARLATNLRLLAVRAADLGLTDGDGEIAYRVEIAAASGGGTIADQGQDLRAMPGILTLASSGPTSLFDLEAAGIDAAGGIDGWPLHATDNGTMIAVDFDVAPFADDALGVLLLHSHNQPGERSEVVTLSGDRPDLTVAVIDTPDPVFPGGSLELEITVDNEGSQPAPGTTISLLLAPEVDDFEAGPSSPECSVDDRLVTCALGDLAPAGSAAATVVLELSLVPNGSVIEHRIDVSTTAIELDRLDNRTLVSTLAFETPLFADGFESGDTSAWFSTQP